jgi:hypothetical protein
MEQDLLLLQDQAGGMDTAAAEFAEIWTEIRAFLTATKMHV